MAMTVSPFSTSSHRSLLTFAQCRLNCDSNRLCPNYGWKGSLSHPIHSATGPTSERHAVARIANICVLVVDGRDHRTLSSLRTLEEGLTTKTLLCPSSRCAPSSASSSALTLTMMKLSEQHYLLLLH